MTVTYPPPTKTKRLRPALPPIAPTPALRADAALAEAHRFLGGSMAQALIAATLALLLSNTIQRDFSVVWFGAVCILLFLVIAGVIWASMQGHGSQSVSYSSGLSCKARGAAKYVMLVAFAAIACGLLVPVAMFFVWERRMEFPVATELMQLALLLGQLLLSVSLSLRAIDAIKYARTQLLAGVGTAVVGAGAN
jgi:hypothetical protein